MSDLLTKAVNAARRVAEVQELQKDFQRHAALALHMPTVPGNVTADDQKLTVECLGHTVTAMPRVIRDTDDENWFCVEYDFRTEFEGESISIWRAYLKGGPQPFLESTEGKIDFSNQYLRQHLLTNVSLALLESPVFKQGSGRPLKVRAQK